MSQVDKSPLGHSTDNRIDAARQRLCGACADDQRAPWTRFGHFRDLCFQTERNRLEVTFEQVRVHPGRALLDALGLPADTVDVSARAACNRKPQSVVANFHKL